MNEANNSAFSKNLKYILILVGIVVLTLSYFLVFRKYSTKSEDIQAEIDSLQSKCDDLERKNNNKADIEAMTKETEEEYETLIKKFDGGVTYQSEIMDNYNMGQNLQIQISRLTLSPLQEMYTFGQLATSNPNGGTSGADASYSGVMMSYTISTAGTYDQMKQTLNYIMNEEGKRKVPVSIIFNYDSTGQQVALSISVREYAITGDDRTQKEIVIPGYGKSTTNVFYSNGLSLG